MSRIPYSPRAGCRWLRILLVAICLRSLIAPGFMLAAGGDGPLGMRVTLCGGLHGINAIDGMADAHAGHHGNPNDDGAHDTDHFTATCGLWTAGGTSIEPGLHDLFQDIALLQSGPHPGPLPPYLRPAVRHSQQPRAPPNLSLS